MKHTRMVLRLLKDVGVTLKLQKRAFFTNKVDYSGHIIRLGRLGVDSHTAEAICELKTTTTVTDLRSFLGLCNVLKRSVPNFVRIVSLLSRHLKKTQAKDLELSEKDEL